MLLPANPHMDEADDDDGMSSMDVPGESGTLMEGSLEERT